MQGRSGGRPTGEVRPAMHAPRMHAPDLGSRWQARPLGSMPAPSARPALAQGLTSHDCARTAPHAQVGGHRACALRQRPARGPPGHQRLEHAAGGPQALGAVPTRHAQGGEVREAGRSFQGKVVQSGLGIPAVPEHPTHASQHHPLEPTSFTSAPAAGFYLAF